MDQTEEDVASYLLEEAEALDALRSNVIPFNAATAVPDDPQSLGRHILHQLAEVRGQPAILKFPKDKIGRPRDSARDFPQSF